MMRVEVRKQRGRPLGMVTEKESDKGHPHSDQNKTRAFHHQDQTGGSRVYPDPRED
jgi:hypothetical protein